MFKTFGRLNVKQRSLRPEGDLTRRRSIPVEVDRANFVSWTQVQGIGLLFCNLIMILIAWIQDVICFALDVGNIFW